MQFVIFNLILIFLHQSQNQFHQLFTSFSSNKKSGISIWSKTSFLEKRFQENVNWHFSQVY